jgi:hypothetical protein
MRQPLLRARHSTAARSRRGAVLILFAMLVFLFLALASIVIDVGTASLTNQEMQVAVDPAALEGVRLRDFDEYQTQSNQHRRPKVTNLVRQVFDDDLHPTGGTPGLHGGYTVPPDDPDALQLGAGPMMRVVNGSGPYAASGTIDVASEKVYDDPVLQENSGNDVYGDMVSGNFMPDTVHAEDSTYVRSDFAAGTGLVASRSLGFLVRMRRTTTGANSLDDVAGVSSSGPSLPLLFGMGSLMHQDPGSTWNPRTDGLNVRATAIAVARPALRASMPPRRSDGTVFYDESAFPTTAMLGLYPIAISKAEWCNTIVAGTWSLHPEFRFNVQSDGRLLRDTTSVLTGRFVAPATAVGGAIAASVPVSIDSDVQVRGYIALYAPVATAGGGFVDRVVGYGFGQISLVNGGSLLKLTPGHTASTSEVTVWVGPNGVSAHLDASAPALSKLEWDAVFAANNDLAYGGPQNPGGAVTYDYNRVRPGTLLAPALAR